MHRQLQTIAILSILIGLNGCQQKQEGLESKQPTEEEASALASKPDGVVVTLNESKRKLLQFESQSMDKRPWVESRTIQAKLALDPDRHFAITSPVNVVVEELLADIGSNVEAGTPLLKLSAPEITQVRGKANSGKTRLKQAEQALAYRNEIQKCFSAMVQDIDSNMEPKAMIAKYRSQNHGKQGALLLESYTRWRSTKQLSENASKAISSGALPEKVWVERDTEIASKRSALDSAIQQAKFELGQDILEAESDLSDASSSLQSALAELDHLQGLPATRESSARTESLNDTTDMDTYIFRSPRAGTVIERNFARGERAAAGSTLLLVADLSKLWVVGELRSQDWDLLSLPKDSILKVEVVGLEKRGWYDSHLNHLGGSVDSASGAIPFAANIANTDGLLRPGMHSRIRVERPSMESSLVLPASALFSHDGKDYLVEDAGNSQCIIRRIKLGRRSEEFIEIIDSLSPEKKYVTRGAFSIASEALLESEE